MSERGPVGGAGELTAALEATLSYLETLVLEHSPDCSYESTDSPRGDFCDCDLKARRAKRTQIYQLVQAALAAKAPQGVRAADILYSHCRGIIDNKQHASNGVREAYQELLALDRPSSEGGGLAANPGYPAPESTGGPQKMADIADEINQCLQIIVSNAGNIQIGLGVSSERAKRVRSIEKAVERAARAVRGLALAAPSAPSKLPVPGPVSDTAIHHGMFPPEPKVHTGQAVGWYRCDGKGEAAAPKPAPCELCGGTGKFKDASLADAPTQPCPCGPTPAPEAERLREALRVCATALDDWLNTYAPDLCDASRVQEAFDRIKETGTIDYIARVQLVVREALAAAPPALTKLQQQVIDAQRTGIAPECFSGGKEQIVESTARNHELEGPALWHEAERIDAITPRYERMEAIATLVKHSRDRHASAERVRELTFARLRERNQVRCEQKFHRVDSWRPWEWSNAMAGEVGEACNLTKKMARIWPSNHLIKWEQPETMEHLQKELAREIADVVIYADLLATSMGLKLEDCIIEKFDITSEKIGSDVRLRALPPSTGEKQP
jgi:NTP pyrophosphatase (non-canonical NTP hydrolase)